MEIRKILVPVDGSELSLRAAETAADLARQANAAVTLLTAVEPPEMARAYVSDAVIQEVRTGIQQAAEAMLEQAAGRLGSGGGPVERRVAWSSPAAAIVEEAANGYDLIVMASRGLGVDPLERPFLGSVAERVLRRANCPVLIIPSHEPA